MTRGQSRRVLFRVGLIYEAEALLRVVLLAPTSLLQCLFAVRRSVGSIQGTINQERTESFRSLWLQVVLFASSQVLFLQ